VETPEFKALNLNTQITLANKIIEEIEKAEKAVQEDDLLNRFKIINIVGEEGSGKSTICEIVKNKFSDWSFHFIENNSANELPRSGIKTNNQNRLFIMPSLSVQLGIFSLGASLEFHKADQIFHDIEKQFVKEINKDYGRSIIYVDNFDTLDEMSKQFVRTVCNRDRIDSIFKFYPIVFIITSTAQVFENVKPFEITAINENEIKILSKLYNKTLNDDEVKKISKLSNGNINFVTNLLKIENDYDLTIQAIVEKRLEDIRKSLKYESYENIEDICVCGAYFENGFTINQLKKIFSNINDDYLYSLFNALNNFCIVSHKNQNYFYSVEQFKTEFKKRKIDLQQLYFSRMYAFYTTYHNEIYGIRLKFAYEMLQCGDSEYYDSACSLLFSFLLQKIYERKLFTAENLNNILNSYALINLPVKLMKILTHLISGKSLSSFFRDTNYDTYNILMRAEIAILKLNYFTYSNSETYAINNALSSAVCIADCLSENESELYAELRLRMSIVSVLINRSTLTKTFLTQINKLKEVLSKYETKNKDIFVDYLMNLNRKSSLYNGCDSAIRDLNDAIKYYVDEKNVYELFKAYVNILGLYAVSSRFSTPSFLKTKNEVEQLIQKNPEIEFDRKEKLDNNLILNEYLRICSHTQDENELYSTTNDFYNKFKSLFENTGLKVARLNMVSLLCRINPDNAINAVKEFLKDNARNRSEDNFYKFYLTDMLVMLYILKQDWGMTEAHYRHLSVIACPPFNDCERHLNKRLEAYKVIIENKVTCAKISSYETLIADLYENASFNLEYYFGSDESWAFYSKGFLLSDAQFFS